GGTERDLHGYRDSRERFQSGHHAFSDYVQLGWRRRYGSIRDSQSSGDIGRQRHIHADRDQSGFHWDEHLAVQGHGNFAVNHSRFQHRANRGHGGATASTANADSRCFSTEWQWRQPGVYFYFHRQQRISGFFHQDCSHHLQRHFHRIEERREILLAAIRPDGRRAGAGRPESGLAIRDVRYQQRRAKQPVHDQRSWRFSVTVLPEAVTEDLLLRKACSPGTARPIP